MNIAAQLSNSDLKLFIEGSPWKKATRPFNKEKVKIDLVIFNPGTEAVFHDAVSNREADTHPSLMFCRQAITLAEFKRRIKKAGYGEPYEIRLGNSSFKMKKQFTDAYAITFSDYQKNWLLGEWIIKFIPVLDAGTMLQRLQSGRRYFTRDFAEYREFENIEAFTLHRFELWHDATVKKFEQAISKSEAECEGCKREKQELERDI